ncbi:hypothetical protein BDV98DRAFT_566866, partial [Pterulicium gracile]
MNNSGFTPRTHRLFHPNRFNIYIYDYCSKRGYNRTARELQMEADISADASPPINARQGLLY